MKPLVTNFQNLRAVLLCELETNFVKQVAKIVLLPAERRIRYPGRFSKCHQEITTYSGTRIRIAIRSLPMSESQSDSKKRDSTIRSRSIEAHWQLTADRLGVEGRIQEWGDYGIDRDQSSRKRMKESATSDSVKLVFQRRQFLDFSSQILSNSALLHLYFGCADERTLQRTFDL